MRIAIALLLLAGVAGCASAQPLDAGYEGSAEGFVAAQRAAATWNAICGVELVHVHEGRGDFDVHERIGILPPGDRIGNTRIYTPKNPFEGKIVTGIDFTAGATAYGVLVHEMGHALFLDLGHAPTGIMAEEGAIDSLGADGELLEGAITPQDCARARAAL